VIGAIGGALGMAASIGHEALFTGVDLLQFVPVPGLNTAGNILLNIWDAIEMVEVGLMSAPIVEPLVLTTDLSIPDESSSMSAPHRTLRGHLDFYPRRDRGCGLHRSRGAPCAHRETRRVRSVRPRTYAYLPSDLPLYPGRSKNSTISSTSSASALSLNAT
jgi:hypothetical protein